MRGKAPRDPALIADTLRHAEIIALCITWLIIVGSTAPICHHCISSSFIGR